ncbi:MAG: TlpA family protein disulfide reductase [Chloroflexi bacterium]|nr:TlpA family protein disulfide reductase [Chloroflexota bacterium]
MSAAPPPGGRERRGLVGPFSGRQIAVVASVVLVAAAVLVVGTAPIAAPAPSLAPVDPAATQYAIGPAGGGLAPGRRPPELAVEGPGGGRGPATTLDGDPIGLADLRGRVVWVDFWASWCPPCRAETPALRDLYERHRADGLEMIGVSVQESSAEDIRRYVAAYGIRYPIVADLTGAIFRDWQVYGLPTQFLLDREGVIRAVVQGPVDAETAENLVAPLLAEEPRATPAP